jgi:hypothetical protein
MSSCVDTPEGISLGQRPPNAWDGEKDIGVRKRTGEGSRIRLHRDEQTTTLFCVSTEQYHPAVQ